MKRIHTYKYKLISKGPIKQSPIKIRFWLWGFAFNYQTNKHIGGFSLNSKAKHIYTKSDSYTQKYPRKIHIS
jgi:hypothetical protein